MLIESITAGITVASTAGAIQTLKTLEKTETFKGLFECVGFYLGGKHIQIAKARNKGKAKAIRKRRKLKNKFRKWKTQKKVN